MRIINDISCDSLAIKSITIYDGDGNSKGSRTYNFLEFNPIVPGSVGETLNLFSKILWEIDPDNKQK